MKAGREHRVPLSKRALAIVNELRREKNNLNIFIGPKIGKASVIHGIVDDAAAYGAGGITVHGFRSPFRD